MTAIKTTNIIEGNLATEPKYFPKGQYVARIVFRIMHTDRKLNPQTIQQQADVFAKGTAVVAWGELSDRPNTWIDRDGTPQATSVINGTRIIPNQLVNQRRANRQQSASTSLPQQTNAVPEQDPWAGQQPQL